MAHRRSARLIVSLSLVLISSLTIAVPALAQEQSLPEVANSDKQAEGRINATAVHVRSGPGENYYPTMMIDIDTPIKVVGIRFEWLKIIPPEGSFSYVAKAYVEKRGDGTVGRVTKPDLNVRAGSSLNPMKTSVQTRLNENEDVKIIGEQDEYFKIAPPEGAYLYVNKRFVDFVKTIEVAEGEQPTEPAKEENPEETQVTDNTTESQENVGNAGEAGMPPEQTNVAAGPTTQESSSETAIAEASEPTTRESSPMAADQKFDALEAEFASASDLPIQDQPVDELLTGYQALITDDELPESMRRIAEHRVSSLTVRNEARENFLAVRKIQDEMQQRQMALKAEREELEQRIKENDVKIFTAVGMLNTSSLQQGREMLYRLTDPANGRTVAYIRTNDPNYATMLGQFIGVSGELTNDQQLKLKVVTPTAAEPVDPAKVHHGVVAQIVPASLLPKASQASTETPGEAGQ